MGNLNKSQSCDTDTMFRQLTFLPLSFLLLTQSVRVSLSVSDCDCDVTVIVPDLIDLTSLESGSYLTRSEFEALFSSLHARGCEAEPWVVWARKKASNTIQLNITVWEASSKTTVRVRVFVLIMHLSNFQNMNVGCPIIYRMHDLIVQYIICSDMQPSALFPCTAPTGPNSRTGRAIIIWNEITASLWRYMYRNLGPCSVCALDRKSVV